MTSGLDSFFGFGTSGAGAGVVTGVVAGFVRPSRLVILDGLAVLALSSDESGVVCLAHIGARRTWPCTRDGRCPNTAGTATNAIACYVVFDLRHDLRHKGGCAASAG